MDGKYRKERKDPWTTMKRLNKYIWSLDGEKIKHRVEAISEKMLAEKFHKHMTEINMFE